MNIQNAQRVKPIKTKQKLVEMLRQMPIIDAHTHLMSEAQYLTTPKDALSVYGQYTRLPMFASGLSQDDWARMHDPDIPLLERWAIAKPHIDKIKHTSFARAAQLTLQHFWGANELTSENIAPISEQIAAENKAGCYQRVLGGHCNIKYSLNQDSPTPDDSRELDIFDDQEILRPVVSLIDTRPPENVDITRLGGRDGFAELGQYLDWARRRLETLAGAGVVAFKATSLPYQQPKLEEALAEFHHLRASEGTLTGDVPPGALMSYVFDELLKTVPSLGMPVAVHTGFWNDFRVSDPTHMIPVIQRHRDVHFDLFHAGIPYVRQMGLIGINFQNTSLNLCWAHSVNAAMMVSALDEYIDQLGIDKIIAFGADVRWMVEKTYGHLELARDNIATVLARRIDRGLLNTDEAQAMAQAWFFDNPGRIYGLGN